MKSLAGILGSIAFFSLVTGDAIGAQSPAGSATATLAALPQARPSWATLKRDIGEVDGDMPLTHLTVLLKRTPERQQEFEEFLREQQDPASPNFHHWLTPVEVGTRFGASDGNVDAVTSWLRSQGLQVDYVSNSRVRVRFSGTAAAVGAAFASRMHVYSVGEEKRLAISATPRIPAALTDIVQAVHGLETLHDKPHEHVGTVQAAPAPGGPKYSSCPKGITCTYYIWPGDFSAIYDIGSAYTSGVNGRGQSIAVIGRSNVYMPDIENFQMRAGLPMQDPVTIIPPGGIDPGPAQWLPPSDTTTLADQSEATLDVTRAGSVAPGATIKLVISKGSATVSGIGISSQYVVDTNPVPAQVMTISFGACEQDAGQAAVLFWDSLFSQAAAEGISAFVSSGDSGIAGCDDHHVAPPATQAASPSYICASSYATCVGGTQFSDSANAGSYWRTTNTPSFESALGYIPEGAWNEPMNSSGDLQVAATGGGVSAFIATPSWQTGPGVPGRQGRYTPDVSFTAAAHDAYVKCQAASSGSCTTESTGGFHFIISSGTSASTPSMAGITALLNQKMGGAQGNLNPSLYRAAAAAGNGVFHDVTVATSGVAGCDVSIPSMCNNSTPAPDGLQGGLPGYLVGPGYDLATGLGSIDVANLLAWWTTAVTATSANYQGLWWASPAGSESGWGINFAHQGDTIFATWFTYDQTGAGNWLVMTAPKTAANTYSGTLYATSGPAFNAVPFNPLLVTAKAEGTGTLTFTDANNGSFSYTVSTTSQTKAITREVFGTMPMCAAATTSLAAATNYTDLWWASPAGSESGWGINLTQEGTTIFASWFTYDLTGKAMWLVATAAQTGTHAYSGTLYQTTGPPLNSVPFNPLSVIATSVGSATFTFSDGNNAAFAYTVNGVSQVKAITREVFGSTGTACQ